MPKAKWHKAIGLLELRRWDEAWPLHDRSGLKVLGVTVDIAKSVGSLLGAWYGPCFGQPFFNHDVLECIWPLIPPKIGIREQGFQFGQEKKMGRFGILIGATILLSYSTAVAASTWQLERQVEGFTNTQSVTAFVKSENAKFMLRCENKNRIIAMFQPEGIISEAGPLFTRYRIGKHSTVKSENWVSLYGIAAYIGAKKDEKNRQEIIDLAKSLMSGKSILIEAENQRETFSLTGSKTAIAEVLSTCGMG